MTHFRFRAVFGSNGNKKICFWNLLTFRNLPPPRLYVETTVVHKEWKTFSFLLKARNSSPSKVSFFFLKALKTDYTVNFESLEIESNWIFLKKTLWRYHQMVVGGKKNKDVQSNNSTWGTIVVKSNFFVHFLGELKIPKRHFEINRPLAW